jgi:hypothetical protein
MKVRVESLAISLGGHVAGPYRSLENPMASTLHAWADSGKLPAIQPVACLNQARHL